MARTKTSVKQEKSLKIAKKNKFNFNKMPLIKLKGTLNLKDHNPNQYLGDKSKIRTALMDALFDGDVDAFKEILAGHLEAINKDEISEMAGVPRSTVFRVISKKSNPTLKNVAAILKLVA